ncbi:sulfatase [Natronorubrum aibiense]|uniref:Sulfatase-like hydrolase/transferase n=1 Tax=Natronorubrum aibiense TaxID=348826 RepID=A0A5P9P2D1_9EURY|nr:sulfatase [Natronorubrum aibiense]QFU82291.1 sulfatase-like hydrolase/transferase [Natronorubrum aibiense]
MTKRDVIWITLESLRQDHVSVGEAPRETTPNLSKIANEGDWSPYCHSHAIWTRPASASILTGLPPSAHQTWDSDSALPNEIETIPEAFREAGYQTAGISPVAQFSPQTGLDRGFDHFHYLSKSNLTKEVGFKGLIRWASNFRNHSGGFTLDTNQQCTGYPINIIAKDHIKEKAKDDDPLFLYLHHGDTHFAYVPPLAWRDYFDDELPFEIDDAIDLSLDMAINLHEKISESDMYTTEEWKALRVMYDTCVAYVDHLVGELVEYAHQMLDNPIIVITADHGEYFGEKGLLSHVIDINNPVTNVPLIVNGLNEPLGDSLVQPADLMQILCSECGVDHSVPIGLDIRKQPREIAITQEGGTHIESLLNEITSYNSNFPDSQFHREDLTSLRTKEWKFQVSDETTELYSLPDEDTDVSTSNPEVIKELEEEYEDWMMEYGKPIGNQQTAEFNIEMKDQLRDLGYLQ